MGSDLSKNATTNTAGQVTFTLPEQAFRVRCDYLGKQYFSDYFIWQDAQVNIHEGTANVFVNSAGQATGGVTVYVFSPTDTYLGVSGTTNTSGIVQFGSRPIRINSGPTTRAANSGCQPALLRMSLRMLTSILEGVSSP
jgi:hypothetical protein